MNIKKDKQDLIPQLEDFFKRFIKKKEKEIVKMIKEDGYAIVREKKPYYSLNWQTIKENNSIALSMFKKPFIFFFFTNGKGKICPKIAIQNTPIILNLVTFSSENHPYFIDERMQPIQNAKGSCPLPVYEYLTISDDKTVTVYSEKKLDITKEYHAKFLDIPFGTSKKSINSHVNIVEHKLILTEFDEIKPNFLPLISVLTLISEWQNLSLVYNFERNRPMHDKMINMIIWIASFWSKKGVIGINLIGHGFTGSKKTPYFEILKQMTGDDYQRGQSAKLKGMIVSFYGDTPNRGAILNANEMFMLDEIMRCLAGNDKSHDEVAATEDNLNKLMDYLDRKPFPATSAKGEVICEFDKPFLSTTNMTEDKKKIIQKIFIRDDALLKRFIFLDMNEHLEENQHIQMSDEETMRRALQRFKKIFGKNPFNKLELLRKFMRSNIGNVKYDLKRVESIRNKISYSINNKFQISHLQEPLIEGAIIMRTIINWKEKSLPAKFIATDEDYQLFEEMLARLARDTYDVVVSKKPIFS